MNDKEIKWGTADWFDSLYSGHEEDSPVVYFSYEKNGYQKHRHRRLIYYVKSNMSLFENDAEFIDIGCATGHLTQQFSKVLNVRDVTGVDFSTELLKGAKKQFSSIYFLKAGLPKLPFPNEITDIVSLIEVLYYVNEEDRSESIGECSRLLRPGGIFIFAANVQGYPYLTPQDAIELLNIPNLKTEKIYSEYYRLAIWGEQNLMRVYRFCQAICNARYNNSFNRRWVVKLISFFRNPAGRLFAKIGMDVAKRLLESEKLFGCLAFINKQFSLRSPSHLIIFARKKN